MILLTTFKIKDMDFNVPKEERDGESNENEIKCYKI